MSGLLKITKFVAKLPQTSYLGAVTSVRKASHWNKDFKPSTFPTTDKEKEQAAKKYGIVKEEYKPYPDDGMGYGDYPKLSDSPIEAKDPYYPYDFPEHKRNFNEPVHANIDLIGEDRYGSAEPLRYSIKYMYACFLGVMTFWFVSYYWLDNKRMFRPVLPKQLAADGKVHYTFEPKN